MVKKKGKSKRTSLKDKYKIQRRVVESHRKSRKQAKRDTKNGVNRHDKKKDPGIPNSWPFKQQLLAEISRARDLAADAQLEKKNNKSAKNLEELMARANASRNEFQAKVNSGDVQSPSSNGEAPKQNLGEQSRRAYLSTLRKVIDDSDIILQVLDARDPMGTRIRPSIENAVLNHYDKKMVLVLNKIDLIPKDAVSGWLNYLRRSRPTLAIKCGTNIRDNKVGRSEVNCQGALSSSCGVGVEGLLGLLKNYARTGGGKGKTCITVGIIGYPNVGESSCGDCMCKYMSMKEFYFFIYCCE
jgi:nuclear GTP-binding protein